MHKECHAVLSVQQGVMDRWPHGNSVINIHIMFVKQDLRWQDLWVKQLVKVSACKHTRCRLPFTKVL